MPKARDLASSVNAGSIPGSRLENDAITASKMAANSVDSSELANDAVSTGKIQNSAITNAKLAFDGGALSGFRNIIINGRVNTAHEINQRGLTHAGVANGAYFADRWKRVDASNMTQIIEEGNFEPGDTYTLSGTGVTTQQLTAPASGNWTLPNIPSTASRIQVERGTVATPFEERPRGLELMLWQRYYETVAYPPFYIPTTTATLMYVPVYFKVTKRSTPILTLPSATNAAYNSAGANVTPNTWSATAYSFDSARIDVGNSTAVGGIAGGTMIVNAEL